MRASLYPKTLVCYETLQVQQPEASGKASLHFEISATGEVGEVTIAAAQSDLDQVAFLSCLQIGASEISFPAGSGNNTITYPLTFSTR